MIAHNATILSMSLQEISPVKSGHWSRSKLPTFAERRREQRRARLFSQLGDFEAFVQKFLQLVVSGKLFLFAAFSLKRSWLPRMRIRRLINSPVHG
jgi:hypothetical protein